MNLKKVKISSLLMLISLIFMIIAYVSILSSISGLDKLNYFSYVGIPGWILLLVGSGIAIKEHKYYIYGFIAFIIMTLLSVTLIILTYSVQNLNTTIQNVIVTASQVASLAGLLMILEALKEAFRKKNDENGYYKINTIGLIYTILVIVQAVLTWFKIQDTNFQNTVAIIRFVLNVLADISFAALLLITVKTIEK